MTKCVEVCWSPFKLSGARCTPPASAIKPCSGRPSDQAAASPLGKSAPRYLFAPSSRHDWRPFATGLELKLCSQTRLRNFDSGHLWHASRSVSDVQSLAGWPFELCVGFSLLFAEASAAMDTEGIPAGVLKFVAAVKPTNPFVVAWTFLYLVVKGVVFNKYSADFANRVVSIIHALLAIFLCYKALDMRDPFGGIGAPNTEAQARTSDSSPKRKLSDKERVQPGPVHSGRTARSTALQGHAARGCRDSHLCSLRPLILQANPLISGTGELLRTPLRHADVLHDGERSILRLRLHLLPLHSAGRRGHPAPHRHSCRPARWPDGGQGARTPSPPHRRPSPTRPSHCPAFVTAQRPLCAQS